MTQPTTQPSSNGPVVEAQHLMRVFRGAGAEVTAVNDVSLTVRHGEFVAVIGRSGSGKTTLLNLVAGLDKPDGGTALVEGRDVAQFTDTEMTEFRRHTVGFVFQSFGLLP